MKKILLLIGILALACSLVLTGCGQSAVTPTPTPYANGGEEPPISQVWISPGKVQVGNFFPGARAEWPITIHNGDSVYSVRYQVTTEEGETSVEIKLDTPLYLGSLSSVVSVYSNYEQDKPMATGYILDRKVVVVDGLVANYSGRWIQVDGEDIWEPRIVTVSYVSMATFSISYRYPDRVASGFVFPTPEIQDWVIITDPTPVLAPYETRETLIVLAMPSEALSPGSKWEFWLGIKDITQTKQIATELCSRWQIVMR